MLVGLLICIKCFKSANAFNNSSLNSWDVSNVTNMYYMFNCTAFQGAIGGWDTGEVTDMSNMFRSPCYL